MQSQVRKGFRASCLFATFAANYFASTPFALPPLQRCLYTPRADPFVNDLWRKPTYPHTHTHTNKHTVTRTHTHAGTQTQPCTEITAESLPTLTPFAYKVYSQSAPLLRGKRVRKRVVVKIWGVRRNTKQEKDKYRYANTREKKKRNSKRESRRGNDYDRCCQV